MGIWELFLLAVGLSMDAFAVSVCKGLAMKNRTFRNQLVCGLWFGGFQALMPLIGYVLGAMCARGVNHISHYISFGLLVLIGANMLWEAIHPEEEDRTDDLSPRTMLLLAVATSIDAMAAGISLALSGTVRILMASPFIGLVTFVCSFVGVRAGNLFGQRLEGRAKIAGGMILILLGVKILLEHLGVIPF